MPRPGRRDDFVAPYFKQAQTDQVVVILKAREPARIMTAIGQGVRWHLQLAWRWIVQYSFYRRDRHWGRLFVRVCPYLPFSARVCLNQHHWLANKMRAEGIDFEQRSNGFLRCRHPEKLQELADSLRPHDLLTCGQKWLAALTPFFKESDASRQVVSIGFSSRKSNIAIISSFIGGPHSINSPSGCWMPIARWASPTRLPPSLVAKSPGATKENFRP